MLNQIFHLSIAAALITALSLSVASPVLADDDDDDGDDAECPCWSEDEARRAIDAALEASPEDWFCLSGIDVLNDVFVFADFIVPGQVEFDVVAVFLDGEVVFADCFVEVMGGDLGIEPAEIEDLTVPEVAECERILREICDDKLPAAFAQPADDGEEDGDDDDD